MINVKENHIDKFIDCGINQMQNSDVFFFYERKFGYSLFFSHDAGKNDFYECQLYEMQLKEDFHVRLKESGMLPYSELNFKFQLKEKVKL